MKRKASDKKGIVLRSTYYVFELYNRMRNYQVDSWTSEGRDEMLDAAVTADDSSSGISIAIVNKDPVRSRAVSFTVPHPLTDTAVYTVNGPETCSCNTTRKTEATLRKGTAQLSPDRKTVSAVLEPHSVNVVTLE